MRVASWLHLKGSPVRERAWMAGEMGVCEEEEEEAREFALSKKLDITFLLLLLLLVLLMLLLSDRWEEGKEGNVCEGDNEEDEDAGSA